MAEIIWTEPALVELEAVADYIARDKPVSADRFVHLVLRRVGQLALFPLSGGKPRELSGTPYRQLVVPPVRVFYRVAADVVYIIHVQRGESDFRADALEQKGP